MPRHGLACSFGGLAHKLFDVDRQTDSTGKGRQGEQTENVVDGPPSTSRPSPRPPTLLTTPVASSRCSRWFRPAGTSHRHLWRHGVCADGLVYSEASSAGHAVDNGGPSGPLPHDERGLQAHAHSQFSSVQATYFASHVYSAWYVPLTHLSVSSFHSGLANICSCLLSS